MKTLRNRFEYIFFFIPFFTIVYNKYKNYLRPTYITTTVGLTSVVFVVGCLAWWTPTLMQYAWAVHHGTSYISSEVKATLVIIATFYRVIAY